VALSGICSNLLDELWHADDCVMERGGFDRALEALACDVGAKSRVVAEKLVGTAIPRVLGKLEGSKSA
jgi:hypothetical protein